MKLSLVAALVWLGLLGLTVVPAATAEESLQALLDAYAGRGNVPGIALYVSSPSRDLEWAGAAGQRDVATGEPLLPSSTFRIASNTKTYVAAAMLRLSEEGQLDLEAAVDTLLPEEYLEALTAGGYDPSAMTVRTLAQHTSGLADYALTDAYIEAMLGDPQHRWTRLEQVTFAMEHGEPAGAPGERFVYSDTAYILLGQIIEDVSGQPLAGALRSLLAFDELGLTATYLESLEDVPPDAGEQAHVYWGDEDLAGLDPSFDLYGGGGLVASIADLGRFYQALFAGEVFTHPETLDEMLAIAPSNEASGAGMGIYAQEVNGLACWQHGGFWGSIAFVCLEQDLTVAVMFFQADVDDESDIPGFSSELFAWIGAQAGQEHVTPQTE